MNTKMFDVVATGGESVIVHGDKACGKTHNAAALAAHFGMAAIIDDWYPHYRRKNYMTRGALILTNELPFRPGPFNIPVQVVSFADAMAQIKAAKS